MLSCATLTYFCRDIGTHSHADDSGDLNVRIREFFAHYFPFMTRSNPPVPAIPLEVILPRITQQCLCKGDACELALDSNFVNAQFLAHQIYYFHTSGLNRLHRRLAVKAIARAFDVQPKDARHALEKGEAIPKGRGEHPTLEVDTEQYLIDWITKNAQNHTAVNWTELLHYYSETFGAAVTPGGSILFYSDINSSYRRR
jgi:hypothetical protein